MEILYEDNHVIVVVKPQNIPSQPDASGDLDMLSQVKEYVRVTYNKPGEAYIGMVQRLDRPSGGVMVFAKTSKAASRISQQIREDTLKKIYYAIVTGDINQRALLEHHLRKDRRSNTSRVVSGQAKGGKYARLSYEVVEKRGELALVKIDLTTGRSHQIRVQMAHIGAPLMGDVRYRGMQHPYLCLWSHTLGFNHPTKREFMEFSKQPPPEWPWTSFSTLVP